MAQRSAQRISGANGDISSQNQINATPGRSTEVAQRYGDGQAAQAEPEKPAKHPSARGGRETIDALAVAVVLAL
ncbi:MAG: hypothetical protein AAGC55_34620, partial [Myxococcota bacterium]